MSIKLGKISVFQCNTGGMLPVSEQLLISSNNFCRVILTVSIYTTQIQTLNTKFILIYIKSNIVLLADEQLSSICCFSGNDVPTTVIQCFKSVLRRGEEEKERKSAQRTSTWFRRDSHNFCSQFIVRHKSHGTS